MYRYILTEKQTIQCVQSDMPLCSEDDILIKVTHCGICRTDRKAFHEGQKDLHMPRVLGHEIVGTIEKIGEKVIDYTIGERVVLHPGIFCGECEACKSGLDQLCAEMKIMGFHIDGGFAEYCLIPSKGVKGGIVIPVPECLSSEYAVLAEPLACAINMLESINFNKEDNLLIFGGGALGVLTSKLWQSKGISDIVIIEPNLYKREILTKLGFETYTEFDQVDQKFSVAIPCCPDIQALLNAIKALKSRGRLGYFSGLTAAETIPIKELNNIHYKELRIMGTYGCSLGNTKKAVALLAQGLCNDLPLNPVYPEDIEENLKSLEQENSLITTIIIK